MEPSDDILLQGIQKRDRDAFAELYQRFHRPLLAYLDRLVNDSAVAEELFQELFLTVWLDAGRFRGRASVRTWMYRIAYNKAVSWLRKKRPASWEDLQVPATDELAPETLALNAIQRDHLVAALARLSPDHRTVIELTFFHQMSYQEIAQVMGCPVGTVKSRMSYARRYLAAVLRQSGSQGP